MMNHAYGVMGGGLWISGRGVARSHGHEGIQQMMVRDVNG